MVPSWLGRAPSSRSCDVKQRLLFIKQQGHEGCCLCEDVPAQLCIAPLTRPCVLCTALKAELSRPRPPYSPVKKEDLGWRKYLPVRKLTEEEWEEYQRVRKQSFKDRCGQMREAQGHISSCGSTRACASDERLWQASESF